MAEIYITGVAGSLGSSLAKMLARKGHSIKGLDIKRIEETPVSDLDIEYYWAATQDVAGLSDTLEGADIIIYASAVADRPLGLTSPKYTVSQNVGGLVNMLEMSRSVDIEKFVYPGSGTIFTGVPPDSQPLVEDTKPKPTNPYSASKYMGEILCNTYHRCYGVPSVILRSGCVYGPGSRTDISIIRFIRRALEDKTIEVRSPEATRTFSFVENVLDYYEAIVKANPKNVVGEVFHTVSPSDEFTMKETAERVVKILDSDSEIQTCDWYEDGEIIDETPVRQKIISTKDKELGINPNVGFEEGVKRTASFYE